MGENWFVKPMEDEVLQDEIRERGDSGEFHSWDYEAFDNKEIGYEDVMEQLKDYREKYAVAGSPEKEEAIVNEVFDIYRKRGIFPIQYYSEQGVISEIEKCIAYKASFEGDTVSCVSGDTEFFTGTRWKRIDQYEEGDMVLQYNLDGHAELVKPEKYINERGFFSAYQYESGVLNSVQTADHDCVVLSDVIGNGMQYVGEHVNGRGMYKIYNSILANKYNSFRIISSVLYDGTGKEHGFNLDEVVSVAEEQGKPYDDELLSMDVDKRMGLLLKIIDKSGKTNSNLAYYEYHSKDPLHREFVASLAFLTGFSIYCTDEYVFIGHELDWLCESSNYKSCTLEGKYCFVVPSHMLVLRHGGIPYVTGNCGAGVGTTLCDYLFPNLYDTPSKHDVNKVGAETLFAKFHNDEYLKRAIKFCFSYKDGRPVPTSVMGGLRLVGSAPTNFRPMNAKAVYERFCPKGGVIYDYCCVSGDTEFFDGTGWKCIRDYEEGDKVLQFCNDGRGELVDPIEYIHYQSKAPFYRYESENFCSCLTGNHDIVYKYSRGYAKIKQDEILERSFREPIPLTFGELKNFWYLLDRNKYILAFLVYFRGTFNNGVVEVTYTLGSDELANIMSILYENNDSVSDVQVFFKRFNDTTEGVVSFRWKDIGDFLNLGDVMLTFKEEVYKKFYRADYSSCRKLTQCILAWSLDRYMDERHNIRYVILENGLADAVQMLFAMAGRVAYIKGGEGDDPTSYLLLSNMDSGYYSSTENYTVVEDPDKYCFTVPSHMLILRYMGKIFVTGNCGFGGRMLGALSSKNNYKYVGTDPNVETMYHLNELGEYIEEVTGRENSYELHCCGSEVFRGKPNSIDFAFSSPPYFDLEVYSDDPTQCYNKFPVLEDWLEGYVRQTIKNIIYMLKPGRVYAVNIADFKVGGGGECAYVDEWIRISKEEGAPLFDNVYLGVTARAGSKEQAAGELKKENILIFKKPL